jgi:hypothetical protein
MSLYTQSVGRMARWLNGWLKVDESQKRELWIKSAVAEENCKLVYNDISMLTIYIDWGWRSSLLQGRIYFHREKFYSKC